MKYLFTLICLIVTSRAMAHEDHALSESVHFVYHIAFWSLCTLVAYKGLLGLRRAIASKKDNFGGSGCVEILFLTEHITAIVKRKIIYQSLMVIGNSPIK